MADGAAGPRRVGLNLLYLVPGEVGGSEVYARRLIGALLEAAPELEPVAYVGPEALDALRAEPWGDRVEWVTSPMRSRSKPLRVAAELTWLPWRARRDRVELLHSLGTTSPPVCSVPSVVTVLDLIYHHFPDTFPLASRLGLRAVVPLGARRADRVIAISAAARDDIVATLRLGPGKVDVVHLGFGMPPPARVVSESELRGQLGLGQSDVVLTVSAALRHKNLERLLEAFARLAPGRDVRLVVAGHAGLEQQRLERHAAALGISERVRFTGWIEQADLEGLFAAARVFAYPSLMEGFGMPVLEAMARGVPVACSAVSALPEVAGDAAELFDPRDPAAIAAAIERLLDDPALRADLIERGRERPAQFTWERAARGTLETYRRVTSFSTIRQ